MANKIYAHASEIRVQTAPGVGDGDPTFTAIPHIQGATPWPVIATDLIDVTTRDSPDNSEESMNGLKRFPEVSYTIMWDPEDSVHQLLYTTAGEPDPLPFEWALPDNLAVLSQDALVRQFEPTSDTGGVQMANITLKPSGQQTLVINAGDGDGDGDGGDG